MSQQPSSPPDDPSNDPSEELEAPEDDEVAGGSPDVLQGSRAQELLDRPAPVSIADLASLCVRFVERAVGVRLDYGAESLPLLDHYLANARGVLVDRAGHDGPAEESREVVLQAAGAYLGEVIRRRHPAWWRLSADPLEHRLELHQAWIVVRPMSLVSDALRADLESSHGSLDGIDLEPEERPMVEARLRELPPVELEEYVAPSTRVEVLDIVVDALRAQTLDSDGLELEPDDYRSTRR
jgi:hypothetical protein